MKEILLIACTTIGSWLVLVKGDQQIIFMLEGMHSESNIKHEAVASLYGMTKSSGSTACFIFGGVGMGVVVISATTNSLALFISLLLTIGLLSAGIFGRIASFRRADRELRSLRLVSEAKGNTGSEVL